MTAHRKGFIYSYRQVLTVTGRRLGTLGKVASHVFRKGKLGLKLTIKIRYLVEIAIAFVGAD
ncbi:hypothetical protein [Ensifer sp. BR816]|uniref:hypothetical protein n=1 Tax=Rhizobium sp. (strain BR816) TaxID=1057002 RepID=UPI00037C8176|nr:hypothetical protein [Ensifer sp. BR816]